MASEPAARASPCAARRSTPPGRLADRAAEPGASVHLPRTGCGLAGGTWSRVEPLIAGRLVKRGTPVTVYDHGD
ncbi:hypothetical protein GCM10027074_14910 [Streptomyces deserti]